jgi:hypothetical protein
VVEVVTPLCVVILDTPRTVVGFKVVGCVRTPSAVVLSSNVLV